MSLALAALAVFVLAWLLMATEQWTGLAKSKPMVLAAGVMWILAALGRDGRALEAAFGHVLLEYAQLLLFLVAATTYVAALDDRGLFNVLRARLLRAGLGWRGLFWITGILAFLLSPVADNLPTALVMGSVVIAVGGGQPRFLVPACVNIVVAANAGGVFSPFGDLTTLMIWQKGMVPFGAFFRLALPAVLAFAVPAVWMAARLPAGGPAPGTANGATRHRGARRIAGLFALTIAGAVLTRDRLHLPPVLGMMTGLGALQLFTYWLNRTERDPAAPAIRIFRLIGTLDWDTLLFFYGVMMGIGALALFGWLNWAVGALYGGSSATVANLAVGGLSAVLDNIPLVYAILTAQPAMPESQWLLLTLSAGVGGSLLSIGSAAGVALMGLARGPYTFGAHLRWLPAILAGTLAAAAAHAALS